MRVKEEEMGEYLPHTPRKNWGTSPPQAQEESGVRLAASYIF